MRTTSSKKRESASDEAGGGAAAAGLPNVSASGLPVLSTAAEVVRALENGPDEGLVVLDARTLREGVRAFLRQSCVEGPGGPEVCRARFTPRHLNVLFGDLTRTQQVFLLQLLEEPGRLVSREDMLAAIRGGDGTESRRTHALNQVAHMLRKKLGRAGRCIETVRGIGFRWNRELESDALPFGFFKVAGSAMLCALVVVAGAAHFAFRDRGDGGGPVGAPFRSIRHMVPSYSVGEPSASVGHAEGHSPWKAVDGDEGTWFESEGPAREGDWIAFRFPEPLERSAEGAAKRRIAVLCGRSGATEPPLAPPCRVECSADPFFAPDSFHPAGNVDPETGRFSLSLADLPVDSVWAVRVVAAADSDLPLTVRESRIVDAPAE